MPRDGPGARSIIRTRERRLNDEFIDHREIVKACFHASIRVDLYFYASGIPANGRARVVVFSIGGFIDQIIDAGVLSIDFVRVIGHFQVPRGSSTGKYLAENRIFLPRSPAFLSR